MPQAHTGIMEDDGRRQAVGWEEKLCALSDGQRVVRAWRGKSLLYIISPRRPQSKCEEERKANPDTFCDWRRREGRGWARGRGGRRWLVRGSRQECMWRLAGGACRHACCWWL